MQPTHTTIEIIPTACGRVSTSYFVDGCGLITTTMGCIKLEFHETHVVTDTDTDILANCHMRMLTCLAMIWSREMIHVDLSAIKLQLKSPHLCI